MMSFEAVVKELTRLIESFNLNPITTTGSICRIGTCCGSRVLTEAHIGSNSLDVTIPYGLQFYLDKLDPPSPREQFSKCAAMPVCTQVNNLRDHSWHHKTVNLPEINCSYTIVIADTFVVNEDEDDEDNWDDEED